MYVCCHLSMFTKLTHKNKKTKRWGKEKKKKRTQQICQKNIEQLSAHFIHNIKKKERKEKRKKKRERGGKKKYITQE